jgi:hypothetical protein
MYPGSATPPKQVVSMVRPGRTFAGRDGHEVRPGTLARLLVYEGGAVTKPHAIFRVYNYGEYNVIHMYGDNKI